MERKTISRPFEIKSIDEKGVFTGYGSVFGITDSYGDVVERGAFTRSLAERDMPKMLWQHRHDEPIGVWLEVSEDNHGLLVKGKLLIDDDPLAKRAYAHLKAGSISGLSIGYSVPKGGAEWDEAAGVNRLKQIELWEISPVTFPANESATVSTVKSFQTKRDLESWLRDAGMSQNAAKKLIAGGFNELAQHRDDECDDLSELQKSLSGLAAKF